MIDNTKIEESNTSSLYMGGYFVDNHEDMII